jgi:L-ascorbate metabolism protein UlaG (beta-lactamase superfamily)
MDLAIGFRWLGVAGIELEMDGQILAIDPFFTRPPFWRLWLGRVTPNRELTLDKIRRCDFVLVSHAHYDHLMDVPDLAISAGAMVFGSANTCGLLRVCGVAQDQIHEVRGGHRFRLKDYTVEVLPAEHIRIPGFNPGPLPPNLQPPLRLRDYRMDSCYSFLIQTGDLRLLHCGNADPGPGVRADVLFTSPARDRAYYESLLAVVRPKLLVPVHWDNLFRPLSRPLRPMLKPPAWAFPPLQFINLTRFKQMIGSIDPKVQVLIPEIFHSYDLRLLLANAPSHPL